MLIFQGKPKMMLLFFNVSARLQKNLAILGIHIRFQGDENIPRKK